MNHIELLKTAASALRTNVMRTTLTMLGIVIGIASVILIVALAEGATSSITTTLSSLGTNLLIVQPGAEQQRGPVQNGNTVDSLTYEDSLEIKRLPGVAATSAMVTMMAQRVVGNDENANVNIFGVSSEYPTVQSLETTYGEFISEDDEASKSKVVVLGPSVVDTLFGAGADPTGKQITIDGKSFRVIGVTKAKGSNGFSNPDESAYVPVTTALNVFLGQDHVSSIQVATEDLDQVDQAKQDISGLITDRHAIGKSDTPDFSIESSKDIQSSFATVTKVLTAMLAGISGVSLVVGGIGIMNIMLVTVTERTREIGLLKAVGAKRKDILTQFLIESIVLTLAGGAIGVIAGETLAFVLSSMFGIPFVLQMSAILLAVGVSTAVGIVFGLYPARRAAGLSPIEALRYE